MLQGHVGKKLLRYLQLEKLQSHFTLYTLPFGSFPRNNLEIVGGAAIWIFQAGGYWETTSTKWVNSGGLPSPQAGFGRITIHPKLVFREVGKLDVSFDDCWMEYIRGLTPLRRLNTSYWPLGAWGDCPRTYSSGTCSAYHPRALAFLKMKTPNCWYRKVGRRFTLYYSVLFFVG